MISYIYTSTRRIAIKLGRVMTYNEDFPSAKSHDCLITRSQKVTWGGVTYCRRSIYTLSTQKAHGPHKWVDDYIVEESIKKYQSKK